MQKKKTGDKLWFVGKLVYHPVGVGAFDDPLQMVCFQRFLLSYGMPRRHPLQNETVNLFDKS